MNCEGFVPVGMGAEATEIEVMGSASEGGDCMTGRTAADMSR